MSIAQRDYILRMIEQLGDFLARIAGAKREQKLEVALDEIGAALGALFGPLLGTLEALDTEGAATLLSTPEKVRAYAILTAERADVIALKGEARRARSLHLRALELHLEASLRGPLPDERAREAILELCDKAGEDRLRERHKRALAAARAGS